MGRTQGLSWFLDYGCSRSRHMTGETFTFLNLKQHERGKIAFRGIDKGKIKVLARYVFLPLSLLKVCFMLRNSSIT